MNDLLAPTDSEMRSLSDQAKLSGLVCATLWRPADLFEDDAAFGALRPLREIDGVLHGLVLRSVTKNLITQVGDQYYMERASGIASPPGQVTGMRLGQGTTAPSKTGAGAAIVTYKTASQVAIDGGFPTSALSSGARRITWQSTWGAGVATEATTPLAEVVITNEASLTNVAGTAANTIARALLSPTVLKGASDTLVVSWAHDGQGA